ncbi:MAG: hypothetical protein IJ168_00390 [Eubacterium sp.]|nr:hypothetical protein [Eubacterium sp.]
MHHEKDHFPFTDPSFHADLRRRFVAFDTAGGLPLFLLKYLLIGGMFSVTGFALLALLNRKKRLQPSKNEE